MTQRLKASKKLALVCLCAIFLISTIRVDLGHLPKLLDVLQDYAETIADHGHSHGLAEDILTMVLGHAHGLGDHEHVPDLLLSVSDGYAPQVKGEQRNLGLFEADSGPTFLFERPPRV